MAAITIEDIRESNRLKKEKCSEVKEAMKDILTEEQLEKFDKVFDSVMDNVLKGVILQENKNC